MLVVTHDPVETERLADRIAPPVGVRIRACGPPAGLARRASAEAPGRPTTGRLGANARRTRHARS